MKRRVGFIGLGDQGAPMASAIAKKHHLQAWARRDASYASLGEVSFDKASDPRELARNVEILCLCLPGDAEVRQLLLQSGVADALPAGAVVINHSTGDPLEAAKLAEALGIKKLGFLDAPVSGGHSGAVARTLTCFVGGPDEILESCRDVIACHSARIALMGLPGSGQMTKLINNVLTVSNMRNIVEAFSLAKAAGVDLVALQGALADSSGGSFILQAIGRQIRPEIADHIAQLNRKDVAEFAEAMRRQGLNPRQIEAWAMLGPDGLASLVAEMSSSSHETPEIRVIE